MSEWNDTHENSRPTVAAGPVQPEPPSQAGQHDVTDAHQQGDAADLRGGNPGREAGSAETKSGSPSPTTQSPATDTPEAVPHDSAARNDLNDLDWATAQAVIARAERLYHAWQREALGPFDEIFLGCPGPAARVGADAPDVGPPTAEEREVIAQAQAWEDERRAATGDDGWSSYLPDPVGEGRTEEQEVLEATIAAARFVSDWSAAHASPLPAGDSDADGPPACGARTAAVDDPATARPGTTAHAVDRFDQLAPLANDAPAFDDPIADGLRRASALTPMLMAQGRAALTELFPTIEPDGSVDTHVGWDAMPADPDAADYDAEAQALAHQVELCSAAIASLTARRDEAAWRLSLNPAMSRRRAQPARPEAGAWLTDQRVAAAELSPRLGLSPKTVLGWIAHGQAMATRLPGAGFGLAVGALCPAKTQAMARAVGDVTAEEADQIETRVLPRAARLTPRQLEESTALVAVLVNPQAAREREVYARRQRTVHRPTTRADGMAVLSAVLTATQAAQMWGAIDAAARMTKSVGDPRTLSQLRADALHTFVSQRISEPGSPDTAPAQYQPLAQTFAKPEPGIGPEVQRATPDAAPAAGIPGEAFGVGGLRAQIAALGTVREPEPQDISGNIPSPFPYRGRSARADDILDLDSPEAVDGAGQIPATPKRTDASDSPLPPDGTGPPEAAPDNRDAFAIDPAGPGVVEDRATREVAVVVPLATLTGDGGIPAVMHGHGPLTREAVAELLDLATTKVRILATTAADTGSFADQLAGIVGITPGAYRVPDLMRLLLAHQQGTCANPWCSGPAETADTDHIEPFADGGPSTPANLIRLCRGCHVLKTLTLFRFGKRPAEVVTQLGLTYAAPPPF